MAGRPCIYGFVLTVPTEWHHQIAAWNGQIQLMKIGCTHTDARPETGNQREQVMEELRKRYGDDAKIDPVFNLPIRAVNTIYSEEVKNIREKMGIPVPENLAESFGLPAPSEWVFSSNTVTTALRDEIANFEGSGREVNTAIFENFSYRRYDTSSTNLEGSVNMLLEQLNSRGPM